MAYKVSVKEHQSFIKARIQNKQAVADYNWFLVSSAISAERKHCISAGHHYGKVMRGVCYYCGGNQ